MRPRPLPAVHVRSAWAGWINVVVAAVVMLATLPGRTQGLGLITEPMLRDLRLDRVTYANINLWATLLGAASACRSAGCSIASACAARRSRSRCCSPRWSGP